MNTNLAVQQWLALGVKLKIWAEPLWVSEGEEDSSLDGLTHYHSAQVSHSGVDWQYLHHKDLGLGLCWNLVTLTHNLWFSWRERDNLVQSARNNDEALLHPTK